MPGSDRAAREPKAIPTSALLFGAASLIAFSAAVLLVSGRPLTCVCGTVKLWYGAHNGPETSQQIADPYSFTHLIHGPVFYAAIRLFGRWRGCPIAIGAAFLVALAAECAWEVLENSPFVVARYRDTVALGYQGDSVVNSLADIAAMAVGFAAAARLPATATILTVLAIEAALAYLYRDNLTLNVIMLLHPFDSLKAWQLGA